MREQDVERASRSNAIPIEHIEARAYAVPTEQIESDGTFEWSATTLVLVEVSAAGVAGLGYTYADPATAVLIRGVLAPLLQDHDAMSIPEAWVRMRRAVRNIGRPGVASMAIAAVDFALWDLKARILGIPLVTLLGAVRGGVPVYGSGGFTNASIPHLEEQLRGWADAGIRRVKMKVGRQPELDPGRVAAARTAIGSEVELYVDANGAYDRKQAMALAARFAEYGVTWFEEPVPHEDLAGLRLMRDRAPAGMEIAAGEYGYDVDYFRRMLDSGAVDVLQADVTRCQGLSGLLAAGALCLSHSLPLSTHTAPMLHLHAACALPALRHLEYFHDHVRIEEMFFDGFVRPVDGVLQPDLGRPGNGLEFRRPDAERFALHV